MTQQGRKTRKALDVLVAAGLLCCLLWDLNAYYVRLPLPPAVFWYAALPCLRLYLSDLLGPFLGELHLTGVPAVRCHFYRLEEPPNLVEGHRGHDGGHQLDASL
ncbi:MAG: hypothetical protein JRM95_06200, partial [Nitrososphaerota archaeon]|nr:hypothetical protein [Nitrososphaerota archaeon]